MKRYAILLLITFILSSCSEPEKTPTEKKEEIPKVSIKDKDAASKKFWELVAKNADEAVAFANAVSLDYSGKVDPYYVNFFKKQNISTTVLLRESFNSVDAFFWTQSQLFNQIANDLKKEAGEKVPLKDVFKLVQTKVPEDKSKKDFAAYPCLIWQRGFGLCDRQAWVFSEIVYQLGGKASLIYLINDETKVSPHTICEVEYKGKSYIIDIAYDKFLENTKFTDLKIDKIKEIWPKHPEIHNCFGNAIRQIPSMPTDYTERMQRLSAILGKDIRFGEPPQNRYHFWKTKYPKMDTRFWGYSIRLLDALKAYKAEAGIKTAPK